MNKQKHYPYKCNRKRNITSAVHVLFGGTSRHVSFNESRRNIESHFVQIVLIKLKYGMMNCERLI